MLQIKMAFAFYVRFCNAGSSVRPLKKRSYRSGFTSSHAEERLPTKHLGESGGENYYYYLIFCYRVLPVFYFLFLYTLFLFISSLSFVHSVPTFPFSSLSCFLPPPFFLHSPFTFLSASLFSRPPSFLVRPSFLLPLSYILLPHSPLISLLPPSYSIRPLSILLLPSSSSLPFPLFILPPPSTSPPLPSLLIKIRHTKYLSRSLMITHD